MKIPDKLHCMHRLSGDYSCSTTPFGGSVEYIRKDVLIEMLKGYSHPLTQVVVQYLIDKINEL